MVTLKDVLRNSGVNYTSAFSYRAEDIYFDDTVELCCALGYILGHYKKFDFEIPEDLPQISGCYEITNGDTSGGNEMKYSSEYRIYFQTIENIPDKLRERLQNDRKMRMTGSLFIEACACLGFVPGCDQNACAIQTNILSLFKDQEEQSAFYLGLNA
ncbi:MAG: hypothetical protein NC548_46935 [Lachnospiraceae bacterium]|nr:hypothetical protein [Lachnospiraceae bacterium]